MTDNNVDKQADELIDSVQKDMDKKIEKVTERPVISNSSYEEKSRNLPGLGEVDLVNQDELEATLDRFDGVLFRVQNCIFKVCYIDKKKGRFTGEIENLRKEKKII